MKFLKYEIDKKNNGRIYKNKHDFHRGNCNDNINEQHYQYNFFSKFHYSNIICFWVCKTEFQMTNIILFCKNVSSLFSKKYLLVHKRFSILKCKITELADKECYIEE